LKFQWVTSQTHYNSPWTSFNRQSNINYHVNRFLAFILCHYSDADEDETLLLNFIFFLSLKMLLLVRSCHKTIQENRIKYSLNTFSVIDFYFSLKPWRKSWISVNERIFNNLFLAVFFVASLMCSVIRQQNDFFLYQNIKSEERLQTQLEMFDWIFL
jgi:hypothetical protein